MPNVEKTKGIVLVIEDNPDWMRRLVKVCEKAGYETKQAKNKDKAVALLKQASIFDAVIADLRLKDWDPTNIDGLDSLSSIPENERPAAVVVTGVPDPVNVRKAFHDFKVIDVLFKLSFDEGTFAKRLELAVRETRKRRTSGA